MESGFSNTPTRSPGPAKADIQTTGTSPSLSPAAYNRSPIRLQRVRTVCVMKIVLFRGVIQATRDDVAVRELLLPAPAILRDDEGRSRLAEPFQGSGHRREDHGGFCPRAGGGVPSPGVLVSPLSTVKQAMLRIGWKVTENGGIYCNDRWLQFCGRTRRET